VILTVFTIGSLEVQAAAVACVAVDGAGAVAAVEARAAVTGVDDDLAQVAGVAGRAETKHFARVDVTGAVVEAEVARVAEVA